MILREEKVVHGSGDGGHITCEVAAEDKGEIVAGSVLSNDDDRVFCSSCGLKYFLHYCKTLSYNVRQA